MILDYLILGGGITGITVGRLLELKGSKNFQILEAEEEAGGVVQIKNNW
jgi:L-2-hydroxyglutarate oxidase LhgO